MIYQVLSPIVTTIHGDSFKEAIKNFVKVNYNYEINQLIFKDQMNHYEAKLRYYKENQKNKVGITVYPYQPLVSGPVVEIINNNPIVGAPGKISASKKGPVFPVVPAPVPFPVVSYI
jgi:hypothetical protein